MGARHPRITPNWVKTVGAMIDEGIAVRVSCRKCHIMLRVDLDAIAAVKGRDYSLLGRTPPCKSVTCDGHCHFLYSDGAGTPFRPLD